MARVSIMSFCMVPRPSASFLKPQALQPGLHCRLRLGLSSLQPSSPRGSLPRLPRGPSRPLDSPTRLKSNWRSGDPWKPRHGCGSKFGTRCSMASPTDSDSIKIGFVGAGQMAEALARGFISSGIVSADRIGATDVSAERLEVFKSFGAIGLKELTEVAEFSDVIILAVKPNTVKYILETFKKENLFRAKHLIVSIAAGVTLQNMQSWSGDSVRIIRVMPNTPCLVGETAAALSLGASATTSDSDLIKKLFSSVGKIFQVDEKLIDAVTGLSGSGPAYVFVAIEALADGGVFAGLPRDIALSLAAQTVLGAAKMVLETGKHPGQLKDAVASPGGTTIAGIHELEKGNFRASLINAVVASAKRSKELSS